MTKLTHYAERLFLWPGFGGITAICGVVAGYLGSLYDREVATALYPWFWPTSGDAHIAFSLEATIFWAAVLLFGVGFTGTFWAQSETSRRETANLRDATSNVSTKADSLDLKTAEVSSKADELAKKTDDLTSLIRQMHTLPPKGFLFRYGNISRFANEVFFSVQTPEATASDIAVAIRKSLRGALELATYFDSDGERANYGCNLMLYRPSEPLSADEAQTIANRMKFADRAVAVKNLKGVLDLVCPLSVSSLNLEGPDTTLMPLALPIPRPLGTGKATSDSSVLPGAPLAFISKAEALIESPADWNNRAKPFSQGVQQELEDFLKSKGDTIQSFVAIPLYAETATADEDPIGILNIHRNLPNALLGEKLEFFAPLLVPIAILLGRLLDAYARKGAMPVLEE